MNIKDLLYFNLVVNYISLFVFAAAFTIWMIDITSLNIKAFIIITFIIITVTTIGNLIYLFQYKLQNKENEN